MGVALQALQHDNLVPRNLDKKLDLQRLLNLFAGVLNGCAGLPFS